MPEMKLNNANANDGVKTDARVAADDRERGRGVDRARAYTPAPGLTWPDGGKCAAMLCFDVDGETTALSEDTALARRRTLMSQCEYGPRIGVPRLLGLLDHLEVPATVFIPGFIVEEHPRMAEGS